MSSRLSTPLQIQHLKGRFCELNPDDCDTQVIDWAHVLDEKLTMAENVEAFNEEYPQYTWTREVLDPGVYESSIIAEARDQVEEFSYEVIKKRRLGLLEKAAARVSKMALALSRCKGTRPKRKPRKKVTCPEASKIKVCFMRCPKP